LRDIFKDNAFIGEILRADHQTQDLLNYQIADIIVNKNDFHDSHLIVGFLKNRGR
jgi:hypothetical protein